MGELAACLLRKIESSTANPAHWRPTGIIWRGEAALQGGEFESYQVGSR